MKNRVFILAGLLLLSIITESLACQCTLLLDASGNPMPAFNRRTYTQADLVFIGRVLSADSIPLSTNVNYRFSVQNWLKGAHSKFQKKFADIQTEKSSAACGEHFDKGETYIVLARIIGNTNGEYLETSNCAGNTLYSSDLLDSVKTFSEKNGKKKGKVKRSRD